MNSTRRLLLAMFCLLSNQIQNSRFCALAQVDLKPGGRLFDGSINWEHGIHYPQTNMIQGDRLIFKRPQNSGVNILLVEENSDGTCGEKISAVLASDATSNEEFIFQTANFRTFPKRFFLGTTNNSSCGSTVVFIEALTKEPTTSAPTSTPTTRAPTTKAPTRTPTTRAPTTKSPTTKSPTTKSPTTKSPTTDTPSTSSPTPSDPTPLDENSSTSELDRSNVVYTGSAIGVLFVISLGAILFVHNKKRKENKKPGNDDNNGDLNTPSVLSVSSQDFHHIIETTQDEIRSQEPNLESPVKTPISPFHHANSYKALKEEQQQKAGETLNPSKEPVNNLSEEASDQIAPLPLLKTSSAVKSKRIGSWNLLTSRASYTLYENENNKSSSSFSVADKESRRESLKAVLSEFYTKHDPKKLKSLESFVDLIERKGIDSFNSVISKRYGEKVSLPENGDSVEV